MSEATRRIIDVRASVLAEDELDARRLRAALDAAGVLVVDVMGSPGSGKTSLILALLERLGPELRAAVIEADLEGRIDADLIEAAGHRAVQLRTGGFCRLDAAMLEAGLAELGLPGLPGLAPWDLVLAENVGNLVCTAQVDTGAQARLLLLSVPEGDDKPAKYPPAFAVADFVAVTKADYLGRESFDLSAFRARVRSLNARVTVAPVSVRTGEGLDELCAWLRGRLAARGESPRGP